MTPTLRLPAAVALVGVCALLDGPTGALIGVAVVAGVHRGATGRQLLIASVATLTLAAVSNLLVGLPDRLTVSANFATDRILAHHLAFGGAVLLVVGVLLDVRSEQRSSAEEP